MERMNPATPAPTQNMAAENQTSTKPSAATYEAYACGTAGPRQPSASASPTIPCGGSWNGDTWAAPCPRRRTVLWGERERC